MNVPLRDIFNHLFRAFGPQRWWPAESPFEVIVGAILTQNAAWKNVRRAIDNLREAGVLSPQGLRRLGTEELAELIRPAGYFRLKAGRLKNVINYLFERHAGDLEAMFQTDLDQLRSELLAVNGVGPETADSILLYAGSLPTFVVDAYTKRIWVRHGWIEPEVDYHALKDHFESHPEVDPSIYNELHALLVRTGNEYCRKRPRCDECPLASFLPEGGICQDAGED